MPVAKSHVSQPKCGDFGGKKRHTKEPCGQAAGHGTAHPGTGLCKLHGGNSGRPPKTGKYTKLPPLFQADYERRLQDTSLKSLDDETALIEAMIAKACEEWGSGGSVDFVDIKKAVEKLDTAIKSGDESGFTTAMSALKQCVDDGYAAFESQKSIRELSLQKATLLERSGKVEERAGMVVSARDFISLIAWMGHFVASEAERHNDPSILRRFQAELVRKGAYTAAPDGGNVAGSSGIAN